MQLYVIKNLWHCYTYWDLPTIPRHSPQGLGWFIMKPGWAQVYLIYWPRPMSRYSAQILISAESQSRSVLVSRVLRAINSMNSFPCWIAILFTGQNLQTWIWQKKIYQSRTKIDRFMAFLWLIFGKKVSLRSRHLILSLLGSLFVHHTL